MANLRPEHSIVIKYLLRYLPSTSNQVLKYSRSSSSLPVVDYYNIDYARDIDIRPLMTNYTFLLVDGLLSWNSQKH